MTSLPLLVSTTVNKSCSSHEVLMSQICILNTIRENEIHAKISVFIVIVAEGFYCFQNCII